MPDWGQIIELHIQVSANFLRSEIETGNVYAEIALSAKDDRKRICNTRNAVAAYMRVLRFMGRVAIQDTRNISETFESLSQKLVALGEMGDPVLGRRLDDRIRKLAAASERVPTGSEVHQKITERIKVDMSEYFEREKNPPYDTDRRCSRN